MEIKNLNLIPEGDKPIIHASQFDENRTIRLDLKDGTEDYTLLADLIVTCNIKKVDGNIVTFEVENTESTYVIITLPLQATACAGPNIGEIVISDVSDEDSIIIGTINFILEVERSPMLGGIESASDIHDLEEQIEVIVTQVIATDYYTKTEVDNLLADKADISDLPDMSDYYDKTEVDTLLNGKVNTSDLNNYYNKTQVDNKLDQKADISDLPDMSDYYTKTAVDNLLSNKADISDLPDMSNYYTKTEVDNKFLDIMPVNSASGAIANFTTLIVATLVALKAYIQAQGGGGTPSAPVAITGFDSVVITQADENMQTINTFTIQLGQTVYGGVCDVTGGQCEVIRWYKKVKWSEGTNTTSLGNYTRKLFALPSHGYNVYPPNASVPQICSVAPYIAAFNSDTLHFYANANECVLFLPNDTDGDFEIEFTGELAIHTALSTTPTQITTKNGTNNIFADSGDIEVSFKQDIQNYVDSKISAANVNRTLSMIRPVTTEESKGDEDER